MEPRLILKTHTEALRPRNYSLLIAKCTHSDKTVYPEVVVKKLQDFIEEKSVAKFTVMLSTQKNRGFGFLLDNMIWSWKGHVINAVLSYLHKKDSEEPSVFEELGNMEKFCFFRYFLETEGALILKFSEKWHKRRELSYSYLKENIQEIFKEIFEEYIDITPDLRSRLKLKNILKQMRKEQYDESTKAHKIRPHIQALEELGILITSKENDEQLFKPMDFSSTSSFSIIFDRLKTIQNMEIMFLNYEYFSLISQIYNLSPVDYSDEIHKNLLKETIRKGYVMMSNEVTRMADIDALIDWCSIKMLAEDNILIRKNDVQNFLDKIRKDSPSNIKYHVDGKGRIAYLIFSEPL